MKLSNESYGRIVENIQEGLYLVDRDRRVIYWNKAAERISGFSAEEVVGKSCADNILIHVDNEGNSLCLGYCPLVGTIADGISRDAEVFLHHKNGHRVPVAVRTGILVDDDGLTIGGVELFTDISSRLAVEMRLKELESLAFLDGLTQLANRTYVEREIFSRLAERERMGLSFGFLFMDIDHFKKFNDTYGHDVGDKVLQLVANTFVSNSRPFDLYGRWGGEEFVGVIPNIDRHNLGLLGNRIRVLIENSFLACEDARLNVTISIGATVAEDGDSIESLVKRGDAFLYKSKKAGRNCLTLG